MANRNIDALAHRTIEDFGDQWSGFTANDGFYGSATLFRDICGPLLSESDIRGRTVAEIGSGTGRIVQMLLDAGASHVLALEPSAAFDVLRRNVEKFGPRVHCVRGTGEELPRDRPLDLVVSIGVLHHIPDPGPVLTAAFQSLKPGGRVMAWVYGRENNGAYLFFTSALRLLTTRWPHRPALVLARALNVALSAYIPVARRLPVPLHEYLRHVLEPMSREQRLLVIYDQLRPAYAKYYTRDEAYALLADAGSSAFNCTIGTSTAGRSPA